MESTIRPYSIQSILPPIPRLPRCPRRELSEAAICARSGSLSVNFENLLLLDVERAPSPDGAWHITEIATLRPLSEGAWQDGDHLAYLLPESPETAPGGAGAGSNAWGAEPAYFWERNISGRVLVGHNVGADFDSLVSPDRGPGLSLINVGLIDTLELALVAFPTPRDDQGKRVDHKLHTLAAVLQLDNDESLLRMGRPHQARYDAALCWRLAWAAMQELGAWPRDRLRAVLQLMSPDCYLRRFLLHYFHAFKDDLPDRRIPLRSVTGEIPSVPQRQRSSTSFVRPAETFRLLGNDSPFGREDPAFEIRPVQSELARAVGRRLEEGGGLLAEAGTGTGKSRAALLSALAQAFAVPAEPVVLSTHTHLLQDQLVGKDIPDLKRAIGLPFRVVLLKGRNNYLDLKALDARRTEQLRRLRDGEKARNDGLFLGCLLSWLCAGLDGERAATDDAESFFFGSS